MKRDTKLTTILQPSIAKPINIDYQEPFFIIDIHDPVNDGMDLIVLDESGVLEEYYQTRGETDETTAQLIKSGKLDSKMIWENARNQLSFSCLNLDDFIDLDEHDKFSYIFSAIIMLDQNDMRLWMIRLLNHCFAGFKECPVRLRSFATILKQRSDQKEIVHSPFAGREN